MSWHRYIPNDDCTACRDCGVIWRDHPCDVCGHPRKQHSSMLRCRDCKCDCGIDATYIVKRGRAA